MKTKLISMATAVVVAMSAFVGLQVGPLAASADAATQIVVIPSSSGYATGVLSNYGSSFLGQTNGPTTSKNAYLIVSADINYRVYTWTASGPGRISLSSGNAGNPVSSAHRYADSTYYYLTVSA